MNRRIAYGLAVVVMLWSIISPAAVSAAGTWNKVGPNGGPDDGITASCMSGKTLYAAGWFSQADGQANTAGFAQYSFKTRRWSSMGGGNPNYAGDSIDTMVCTSTHVYVGGTFPSLGGSGANIAVYTIATDTWGGLGSGADAPVDTLYYAAPTLYMGGTFTSMNGLAVKGIAAYNTTTQNWDSLGSENSVGTVSVTTIAATGSDIIVGGQFSDINGVVSNNLAAYNTNSQTWQIIGTANNIAKGQMTAVNGIVYLAAGTVGSTVTTSGLGTYNLATQTWTAHPSATNLRVHKFTVNKGSVYVISQGGGGNLPYLKKYNPTSQTFSNEVYSCNNQPTGEYFVGRDIYFTSLMSIFEINYVNGVPAGCISLGSYISRYGAAPRARTSTATQVVDTLAPPPSRFGSGFPYSAEGELDTAPLSDDFATWESLNIRTQPVLTDTLSISNTLTFIDSTPQWPLTQAEPVAVLGTRAIRDANNPRRLRPLKPSTYLETGFTLSGYLLDFWNRADGIKTLGYPVSDPYVTIDPTTGQQIVMQYTERGRLEQPILADGSYGPPQLGRIGAEYLTKQDPLPAAVLPVSDPNDPNITYFAETRHTLQGVFADYFTASGGLTQNGYPLSEPFIESYTDYTYAVVVQYFERVRMEYHGDPADPLYGQITLGRLGAAVYDAYRP